MDRSRGRSIKSVLINALRILTWILPLSIVVVPLYLVTKYAWIPAFSPDFIVPAGYLDSGHVDQSRCYMSWQEPFDYELTFYASEMFEFPSRRNGFFKNAQLLWRTEPQNMKNKYPVLQKNVNVSLSADVFSQHKPVYIFAFAQRYGQFTRYPNTSDPLAVGARALLFSWKQSSMLYEAHGNKSQPTKRKSIPVYAPTSMWSIALENVAYPNDGMPKFLLRPERNAVYPGVCLYQPLLFPNIFTSRKVKMTHLPSIRNPSLEKPIYQTTFEVKLEFRGIRNGWVELRSLIHDVADNIIKGGSVTADSTHMPGQPNRSVRLSSSLEHFITKNSVFELLVIGLCGLFLLFGVSAIFRITLGLLVGPSSARVGFSKLSLVIYLVCTVLAGEFHTLPGIVMLLANPIVIFRAVTVLVFMEVTLNPWKWVKMLALRLNIRQSNSSAELDALPETQLNTSVTSTKTTQEERISRIRADTDAMFARKIRQTWFPITGFLLILSLYRTGYQAPTIVIIRNVTNRLSHFLNVFASAIQLVVNHRARSGSLVPVGLAIWTIFCYINYRILSHFLGYKVFNSSTTTELIIVVPSVIHVAQWIAFYKSKQE